MSTVGPKILTVKCPKCSRVEKYTITDDDLKEIKQIGIARVGFLHGDHSLIINFDPTGFIRGAYVVPSDQIPSDVRTYYKDFKIISVPKVKSDIELIIIDEKNRIIDTRLADITGSGIIKIMNYMETYGDAVRGIARRIGILGRSYNIVAKNSLIIIFTKLSTKQVESCIECFSEGIKDPYSLQMALKYMIDKTPEALQSEETKRRIKILINANKVKIRAKKGTNAIRFARASIIALWPELEGVFDTIIRDPQIMSGAGILLISLIRKNPGMDMDGLFDMLRELKKRDLIEIVEQ